MRVAGEAGVVLAERLRGELALPCVGRQVVISPARLRHHALVMGATGSGKTETLLRLAWVLAKRFDAQVLYLDGKGDRECAARFCALMADAGRDTRVFPNEPFDGWRGEPQDIHGRLAEIVDYAVDGPAAWYRDIARHVLSGVCLHPDGPPRSSGQALERMDLAGLKAAHGVAWAKGLREDLVSQTRLRYQAFFTQTRGVLDGGWSWDETPAAYCLLDTLALRDEASGLARFLLEDFAQYFAIRKPRERLCVMIVDEFSSLTAAGSMASRLEQARGFNTALILAPQTAAGLGRARGGRADPRLGRDRDLPPREHAGSGDRARGDAAGGRVLDADRRGSRRDRGGVGAVAARVQGRPQPGPGAAAG